MIHDTKPNDVFNAEEFFFFCTTPLYFHIVEDNPELPSDKSQRKDKDKSLGLLSYLHS